MRSGRISSVSPVHQLPRRPERQSSLSVPENESQIATRWEKAQNGPPRSSPEETADAKDANDGLPSSLSRWERDKFVPSIPRIRDLNSARKFGKPAKSVRELHLPRRPALRLKQLRTAYNNTKSAPTRSRDVEPVQTVKKFHPARSIFGRGGRQRIDHNCRLLTLKLIHGSDAPIARQWVRDVRDLHVVWSDAQNILRCER